MTERFKWRPFFATGELIEDYEVLRIYWDEARENGREDLIEASMLNQEDFMFIEESVARGIMNLLDLMIEAARRFNNRVDEEIARRAFARLGVNISGEEAAHRISWILAGWLLEASKEFKIVWFEAKTYRQLDQS